VVQRWFSPRALLIHLGILIWAPGCMAACWWQVTVALAGDALGWVYSIEWPILSALGVLVWWHLITDDPDTVGARGLQRARRLAMAGGTVPGAGGPSGHGTAGGAGPDGIAGAPGPGLNGPAGGVRRRRYEEEDPDLAAYNDYLAALAASGRRKSLRRP
jgi:hypothetical protein